MDCVMHSAEVSTLADVLKEIRPLVSEVCKVSDYRFVEFGKGSGALADALRQHLESARYDVLQVDTAFAEYQALGSVLREHSGAVVSA